MKITLVTPRVRQVRTGNRTTAQRWARMLRAQGHRVRVSSTWDGRAADLLLALHAHHSHDAIRRFRATHPDRPILLALTGTDLYRDLPHDPQARASLRMADAFAVLQEEALKRLPRGLRSRSVVIHQSAVPGRPARKPARHFQVCVVGHLRAVKDPLRAALALAHLPTDLPVRVLQLGAAIEPGYARAARTLARHEPRYRWRGEVSPAAVRRAMATSHVLVVSSRMEGGANVISEALACGLPVLASRIPGNIGMLGADYPGYFPFGNERALARLIARAATDADFYRALRSHCRARAHLFTPAREARALRAWLRLVRPAPPTHERR